MDKQDINIIIPSRNRLDFLKNLIEDLKKQTLQPDKVIIVDQSNTPYELPTIPELVHIIDDHRGPCQARNLGLKYSSGEIIVFLDDDIRIKSEFLKKLCLPIIEGNSKVVIGAICDEHGNFPYKENINWRKNYANWLLAITANPDFPGDSLSISFPAGCAAIHRSVYQIVGGFDPFFDPNGAGEDREYALRIFHAGFPIMYKGEAIVKHIGATAGGRRGTGMGFKYQNILEANSVYIVAKHFSWKVFDEFCNSWLRSIINRGKGFNPRIWGRTYLWWVEARQYIKRIREIKRKNNW